MKTLRSVFKDHGRHMLFGTAILSLSALLAWWSVFIHRSIITQRELRLELLSSEMQTIADRLQEASPENLVPGVLAHDNRFEITSVSGEKPSILLHPRGLYLRPSSAVLDKIEQKTQSLNLMWLGESGLLSLIVLISIFFLYRNVQIERRTFNEVREFWKRSAHEIKTPITGIKAFLQNLQSQPLVTESMAPYVKLALRQVERQEKLANNILAGYRLDIETSWPQLDSIDITIFLEDYFNQEALHLFNALIHKDYSARPSSQVQADRRALKVILDNITVNAVKCGPSRLVLIVDVSKNRGFVEIHFSDNGPGFDPALAENLFQAFRRLERELPSTPHGTGLGLYISRRLARAMGGDLKASSSGPGQGARFTLQLKAVSNET